MIGRGTSGRNFSEEEAIKLAEQMICGRPAELRLYVSCILIDVAAIRP
jgi:hypothetical protein